MAGPVEQPSKNHHYVTQAYLRRFANGEGKVWDTWLTKDGILREKPRATKSAGSADFLYSTRPQARWEKPTLDDAVERKFFQPLDDEAARAITKLIEGPSDLDEEQAVQWARFVNSLLERTPEVLERRLGQLQEVAQETVSGMLERAQSDESRRRFEESLSAIHMDGLLGNMNLNLMAQEIDDPAVLRHLAGLCPYIMTLDVGFLLPTSDNPVLVNMGKPGPIQFYSMSLSPRTFLIALPGPKQELDRDFALQALLAHCCFLPSQSKHMYSQEPLRDGVPVKFRRAAAVGLTPVPWRNTKKRSPRTNLAPSPRATPQNDKGVG